MLAVLAGCMLQGGAVSSVSRMLGLGQTMIAQGESCLSRWHLNGFVFTGPGQRAQPEEMETGLLVFVLSLLTAELTSVLLFRGCGLLSSRGLALLLSDDDDTSPSHICLSDTLHIEWLLCDRHCAGNMKPEQSPHGPCSQDIYSLVRDTRSKAS